MRRGKKILWNTVERALTFYNFFFATLNAEQMNIFRIHIHTQKKIIYVLLLKENDRDK